MKEQEVKCAQGTVIFDSEQLEESFSIHRGVIEDRGIDWYRQKLQEALPRFCRETCAKGCFARTNGHIARDNLEYRLEWQVEREEEQ